MRCCTSAASRAASSCACVSHSCSVRIRRASAALPRPAPAGAAGTAEGAAAAAAAGGALMGSVAASWEEERRGGGCTLVDTVDMASRKLWPFGAAGAGSVGVEGSEASLRALALSPCWKSGLKAGRCLDGLASSALESGEGWLCSADLIAVFFCDFGTLPLLVAPVPNRSMSSSESEPLPLVILSLFTAFSMLLIMSNEFESLLI